MFANSRTCPEYFFAKLTLIRLNLFHIYSVLKSGISVSNTDMENSVPS